MVTLATLDGASLSPDIGGAITGGLGISAEIQRQRLQRQQAEAEAARRARLGELTGQLGPQTPGATPGFVPQQPGLQIPAGATPPVTPQLGAQPAPVQRPAQQPIQRPGQRTQALAQLAVEFPDQFEQLNTNLGLITQRQKNEAADFAFKLSRTPFAQREAAIRRREDNLIAQGRNVSDTSSLRGLAEEEQNAALETVQISALTPEERIEVAREGQPALQNIVEAADGGFIGIDPRTRESVFVPPPVAGVRTQKQVDAEIKKQEERVTKETAEEKDVFVRAEKLRAEISKASTEFNKINSAFGRIEASSEDPSAAGDLALIFNFMKMLDPGSVVRESEFATAANSVGVPDRVRNQYNRVLTGERLAEKQRADFLNQAGKIFTRSQKDNKEAVDKIVDIGDQFGVSRDQLLGRQAPTGRRLEDLTVEELRNITDEELQALTEGTQ